MISKCSQRLFAFRKLQAKHNLRMAMLIKIQSGFRMFYYRRKFIHILNKIKFIQGFVKSIYLYKKFKRIQASAKVINRNLRMLLGKIRAKKR